MSFEVALTGLNAASEDLGTIGHNIANASTSGFKSSRAEFADLVANAQGSGVRVSSVSQNFSQGSISFTDSELDLAISGNGFFRVSNNGETLFTRAGAFHADKDGYIVNDQGMNLTGFGVDPNGQIIETLGNLRVNTNDIAPSATTRFDVAANLDASAPSLGVGVTIDPADTSTYTSATSATIYDSLGNPHAATMYLQKESANTWNMEVYINGSSVGGPDQITFDTNGYVTGTGSQSYAFAPAGASAMNITFDYSEFTQFGSDFSVFSLTQDGYPSGRMTGLEIGNDGVIVTRFSNGQTDVLGQVAISNFSNVQGLRNVGNTMWAETFDSGQPINGKPGTGSLGLIEAGALEDSNVDLTAQLVKMITAQRNFQANAQVISTADQVTQAVLNIR